LEGGGLAGVAFTASFGFPILISRPREQKTIFTSSEGGDKEQKGGVENDMEREETRLELTGEDALHFLARFS
jgi:hypothetical protein